jgi:hypothetical protein
MPEECLLRGRAALISMKPVFPSSASASCIAKLGSFPHWIEGTAGVRVDDFNTVVGGISRRRWTAARDRVRRVDRGRAEGESESEGASRRPNESRSIRAGLRERRCGIFGIGRRGRDA